MRILKKALLVFLIEVLVFSPMFEISAQNRWDRENAGKSLSPADSLRAKELRDKIAESKKQARELAKQKWTRAVWLDETSSSRGPSSRTTGTILGFTLGASAGMLIGKGLQGQKVDRTVYHPPGEWGDPPGWTEEFYSYKNRRAPYVGAAIGGVTGGLIGYSIGRSADKYYYCLVPKHIRMAHTKSSGFTNFLFGFGFVGLVTGGIAGSTLHAPLSGDASKTGFGWPDFWGGYLVGSVLGIVMIDGINSRARHLSLWERSLSTAGSGSSIGIRFVPLDLAAIKIRPCRLQNGAIQCEYGLDLIRVNL